MSRLRQLLCNIGIHSWSEFIWSQEKNLYIKNCVCCRETYSAERLFIYEGLGSGD